MTKEFINKNIISLRFWLKESPNDPDYNRLLKFYSKELNSLTLRNYKKFLNILKKKGKK